MVKEQKQETEQSGFDPNNVVIYTVKDKSGNAREAMDLESLKIWLTQKISEGNPFYVNTEGIKTISEFENLIYNSIFVELNELLDTKLGLKQDESSDETPDENDQEEKSNPKKDKEPIEGEVETTDESSEESDEADNEEKKSKPEPDAETSTSNDEDDDVVTLD